jgi:hypothetical protein
LGTKCTLRTSDPVFREDVVRGPRSSGCDKELSIEILIMFLSEYILPRNRGKKKVPTVVASQEPNSSASIDAEVDKVLAQDPRTKELLDGRIVSRTLPCTSDLDYETEIEQMRREQSSQLSQIHSTYKNNPIQQALVNETKRNEWNTGPSLSKTFLPAGHRITKMKITEQQVIQLLEIANGAIIELDSCGGYTESDIRDLLEEVRGQMNTEPVELSSAAESL